MRWDAEKYDAVKAPQIEAGKELVGMACIKASDRILDVGCGTGKLTLELARRASSGRVTGIDPSHEMVERALKVCADIPRRNFVETEVGSIDFHEEFDLAFSNSALQWVKGQREALQRIHLALKPGGRIAFQFPARRFCRELFDYTAEAIGMLGYERYFADWSLPWYLPTKEEYETLLAECGFRQVNVLLKEYRLVFSCVNEVMDWWSSAGLRPFLAVLPQKEQEYFTYAVAMNYENNRTENGIEFDFKRIFAFAKK